MTTPNGATARPEHSPSAAICWHCHQVVDHSGCDREAAGLDDVTVCARCGIVGVFGSGGLLERPTRNLLDALAIDHGFMRRFVRFAWARQYAAIRKVSLLDEVLKI